LAWPIFRSLGVADRQPKNADDNPILSKILNVHMGIKAQKTNQNQSIRGLLRQGR
jgi:hypothetical protein